MVLAVVFYLIENFPRRIPSFNGIKDIYAAILFDAQSSIPKIFKEGSVL